MSRKPALYPFGMKIASRAKQLQDRKAKAEEYGRNDAFSNRHHSYTFDLPLAARQDLAINQHRAPARISVTNDLAFNAVAGLDPAQLHRLVFCL
jgi:hypothetical protein